jgi:hypothetical protein
MTELYFRNEKQENDEWVYYSQPLLLKFGQTSSSSLLVSMIEATSHVFKGFLFHSSPLSILLLIILYIYLINTTFEFHFFILIFDNLTFSGLSSCNFHS